VNFLAEMNDGEYDEILAYKEILDKLETNLDKEFYDTTVNVTLGTLWYTKDPFILPTSITKDLDSMYL
jgi:hypothetical protein